MPPERAPLLLERKTRCVGEARLCAAYRVITVPWPTGGSSTTRIAKLWPFTYLAMHFDSEHGPPVCRFLFIGRVSIAVGPRTASTRACTRRPRRGGRASATRRCSSPGTRLNARSEAEESTDA